MEIVAIGSEETLESGCTVVSAPGGRLLESDRDSKTNLYAEAICNFNLRAGLLANELDAEVQLQSSWSIRKFQMLY